MVIKNVFESIYATSSCFLQYTIMQQYFDLVLGVFHFKNLTYHALILEWGMNLRL